MFYFILLFFSRSEEDLNVQTEGCIVLYLLTEHNDNISSQIKKYAIESYIHDLLFLIVEYFNKDDQITLLALKCLMELSTDQELKDMVLQRACYHGYIKCAEFMLQYGANVDSSSGNYLSMAALKGNLKLVELLLLHDASDAVAAFDLAMAKQHWEIAGVLLRNIGYEKESGMITWSAMNISEMKPELFYPTLTSKLDEKNIIAKITNFTPLRRNEQQKIISPDDLEIISPKRKISDPYPSLTRCRSSTTSDIESGELSSSGGRSIKTKSGAILPYNILDPRLKRRNSNEKHIVVTSPKEDPHYPGHPNSTLIPEMLDPKFSFGNLLTSDRCVTPIMIEKSREDIKKSLSDLTVVKRRGKSATFANDEPPPKIKRPYHSPKQKTKSCLVPFQEEICDAIKLLDISHNNLTQLDEVVHCPSPLIKDFFTGLENLDLSNNHLSEIPGVLCENLPRLKVLNASNNEINRFPYNLIRHQYIEVLDLSKNKISTVDQDSLEVSLSVVKLDLSSNQIREFPTWISEFFPRVSKLLLVNNRIKEIPETNTSFRSLVELNISRNCLTQVSEKFFKQCVSLVKVDLSRNQLMTLPNYTPNTLSKLHTIKLAHNKLKERRPFYIPKILLFIPTLQFVDLTDNKITQLPEPQLWSSRVLRELIVSKNLIRDMNLNKDVSLCWPKISRLNLSYNNLEELPSEIGHLTTLCSLDVSHNSIVKLPDEIGRLVNLYEFPLDGLKLRHDSASLGSPRDMVSFFKSKLKNAVPYRRIKLMLVGLAGRGKTTLVRQLARKRHLDYNVATNGIEINDWILKPPRSRNRKGPSFVMNTWDFAGQEDFYSTHQYFLSQRALYLAVYDVSRGIEEINTLTPWLLNIQAAAPGSMVVLVGTHSDEIPKEQKREFVTNKLIKYIQSYLKGPGFPTIRAKVIVNCTNENSGIEYLRGEIYDIISSFTYKGQPFINQLIPKSYVELEELIQVQAHRKRSENRLPISTRATLWSLCVETGIHLSYDEFERALKFLKETG